MHQYDQTYTNHQFTVDDLIEADFESCTFINCIFTGKDLTAARFEDCDFNQCDLSNVKITRCGFRNIQFYECKLIGLHFDQVNRIGFEVAFRKCKLNHSSFFELDLKNSSFDHCDLNGVDFVSSDLSNCLLTNCDFTEALFDQTKLVGADLSGSINIRLNPDINSIDKARLPREEALFLLDKYNLELM